MDKGDLGSFVRVVTLGMRTTVHWFDPQWEALQKSVDAALPGRVNLLSGSFATGTMLVFSTGDVDPGTWHVLDLASMSLKQFDALQARDRSTRDAAHADRPLPLARRHGDPRLSHPARRRCAQRAGGRARARRAGRARSLGLEPGGADARLARLRRAATAVPRLGRVRQEVRGRRLRRMGSRRCRTTSPQARSGWRRRAIADPQPDVRLRRAATAVTRRSGRW